MAIESAVGDGPSVAPVLPSHDDGGSVSVADAKILFLGDYSRQGHDLLIEHDGTTLLVQDYFAGGAGGGANLVGPNGAFLTSDVVEALAGPAAPGQYAQAGTDPTGAEPSAAALVPIGKAVSVEGSATATHSDGVTVNLADGDPVYQGDVVRTGPASKLGISFIDDTVFSLSADARMVLDELVFDPAKVADSSMVVNLVQGSFVFVTGQVAPSGNMKVETPVATMGIRGTTPKVLINTDLGVTEFTILPDPGSGKIGSYLLIDKTTGEILGTVETTGDKWVITSLSGEAVKIAKSGLDLLEDERALTDIRDAVSDAIGKRAEYDGSNSFKQVAFDSSSSADGQDGTGGPGDGGGPGGGNGGVVDPTPDSDDPPIAGDDAFTTNEDLILVGGNVINASGGGADVDPDGFALTVTQVDGVNLTFLGGTASVILPADAANQTVGAILLISQNGGITYDPTSAFNYLAVGEQRIDSFTYTITDQFGFTDTATVNITVQGRNDAPVITAGPVVAEIAESSESGGVGGGFIGDARTGTLTFTDVDITDTGHEYDVISVLEQPAGGAPPNPLGSEALLAMLNTLGSTDSGTTGTDGTIVWTFTGDEDDFDYLAAGESVTLVYTVQVTDQHGATDTQTVTIKIVGASDSNNTNDAPVISVAAGDSAAETVIETNAGLTESGTLTVTEVDLTDTVALSVVSVVPSGTTTGLGPDNTTLLDMLSLSPTQILTDATSISAQFTWTFGSDGEAFDYLDDGEILTLTYTVQASDDSGTSNASDTQTVTVTVTGTNDAPVISVGAGDSVAETVAETNAGLAVSGTLTVVDVDLSDAVTPTVFSVVASGTTTGLAPDNAALQAMLSVTPGSIAANAGTANNLNWAFNSGAEAFNYLDDGESLTLTYTIRASDDNGVFDDQTVTVTITGTNDAPDISVGTGDSAAETVAETNAGLAVSGTLTVVDVDLSDAVTPTVFSVVASGTTTGLAPDNAALQAMLTVTPGPIAANAGAANNLNWAFNSGAEAFNYLDDGESLTLTYTIRASDDNGVFDDQTVTVTITGSNDAPVISVGAGDSAAETVAETNAGLAVSGTLTVVDADLSDAVTPTVFSVAASGTTTGLGSSNAALLNMLQVTPVSIAADAGTANNLNWAFNSGAEAFNYLDDGESLTLTYTVRASDDNGVFDDQTVTVTITGSNDAPVISVGAGDSAAETVAETNAGLTESGTLTVVDVDLSDAVTPTVVSVATSGMTTGLGLSLPALQAMLSVTPGSINADAGTANNLNWAFSSGAEAFNYLDDDESLTLTYTIRASDDNGVFDDQTVAITITGSNDAPDISAGAGDSAAKTIAETNAGLTESGTLTVVDVDLPDLDDEVTLTVFSVVASGTTAGLGSNNAALQAMLTVTPGSIADAGAPNNLNWAFNSGAEAFDYLEVGQSLTLTYTVRATDADGVFDDQTVAITITGTDEAPNLLSMSTFSFSEETDPDAQTFFGTDGDDTLLGSPGDDQLFGDYGDDILQGNGGSDTLEGGEGADRFILVAGDMDVDQILDFNTEEDSIVLAGFDFGDSSQFSLVEGATPSDSILRFDSGSGYTDIAVLSDVAYTDPIALTFENPEPVVTS